MKRIVSLIVALCMLLTLTAAFAEDANKTAFTQNLQSMLNRVDLTKNALSAEADGKTYATLQSQNGVVDLNIPGVVDLQVSQDTIWISNNGQVIELPIAELQAAIQELKKMFVYDKDAGDTVGAMLNLLVQKVITPGVSMDYTTGAIKIHLTGEQMLQGLAEFGDEVVANPDYMNLIAVGGNWVSLINYIASSRGYYRASFTPMDAEKLAQQWPQLKSQILATKSTLVIDGSITTSADGAKILLTAEENGKELLNIDINVKMERDVINVSAVITSGDVQYTVNGQITQSAAGMTMNADYTLVAGGETVLTMTLNEVVEGSQMTETFSGTLNGTDFSGGFNINMATGVFSGNLDIPARQISAVLEGTIASGSADVKLDITEKGNSVISINLNGSATASGDINGTLTAALPGANIALQLASSKGSAVFSFTITSGSSYAMSMNAAYQFMLGDFPHFKLETTTATGYYSSTQGYSYDGEKVSIWNDYTTMTITGKFVSPTEYQLVFDVKPAYGSSMTITGSAVLEDAGDTWRIPLTLTGDMGDGRTETYSAAIVYGPQTGFEPLADKVTQTLTKDAIMQMLFPAAAAVTAY